jgi:hypothetical protein
MPLNRLNGDGRACKVVSTAYDLEAFRDDEILVSGQVAPVPISIPAVVDPTAPRCARGDEYVVQTDAGAGANPVTIAPNGTGTTINGAASLTLGANQRAVLTCFDGSNYSAAISTAGGGAGAVVATSFVWRPGGVTGGNVWSDDHGAAAGFSAMCATMRTTQGPKNLQIDDSLISPAHIPTSAGEAGGVWTFSTARDVNVSTSGLLTGISFDTGCSFGKGGGISSLHLGFGTMTINGTDLFSLPSGLFGVDVWDAPTWVAAGAGGFINVTGTGFGLVHTDAFANWSSGTLLKRTGAGATLLLQLLERSALGANVISSAADAGTLQVDIDPAVTFSLAQAGVPTGLLVVGTNAFFTASISKITGFGGGAPALQAFNANLVGGVSAFIPATITASSRIVPGVVTMTPGAGSLTVQYAALAADRVIGLAGAGGGFKLTALLAAGTINVLDTSNVDAQVAN